MSPPVTGRGALAISGLAALLASSCCLGPLVLITLGVSGAWISNLAALEPYRPYLLTVAMLALALAGWRLYRPADTSCVPDANCAQSRGHPVYKALFWVVGTLVLIAVAFPYVLQLFIE